MEFFILESFLGNILILSERGIPFRVFLKKERKEDLIEFVRSSFPLCFESYKDLKKVVSFFEKYLSGKKISFDLPFNLSSLSPFQKSVLLKTKNIPYGELRTYEEIAKGIGNPRAQRSVGQALKVNPLPIIIPCHRVIKKDGGIGGFSLGIDIKRKLLEIEGLID